MDERDRPIRCAERLYIFTSKHQTVEIANRTNLLKGFVLKYANITKWKVSLSFLLCLPTFRNVGLDILYSLLENMNVIACRTDLL
jgi:hypothetical protein